MNKRKWVSGSNNFNNNSFNEMCGLLKRGEEIEVSVSCIGHTRNNMVQEDYKRELEKEFGKELITTFHEGVCSYSYSYKLKKNDGRGDEIMYKLLDTQEIVDEKYLRELLFEYEVEDLYNHKEEYINGRLDIGWQLNCVRGAKEYGIEKVIEQLETYWNVPIKEMEK